MSDHHFSDQIRESDLPLSEVAFVKLTPDTKITMDAVQEVLKVLTPLDEYTRGRVLRAAAIMLDVNLGGGPER